MQMIKSSPALKGKDAQNDNVNDSDNNTNTQQREQDQQQQQQHYQATIRSIDVTKNITSTRY